jgi:hypothetical protein
MPLFTSIGFQVNERMFMTVTMRNKFNYFVFYGLTQCIFLPQHVSKTNCKPKDDLT